MIRAITVTNYLGDSIKLDLARPEQSGFVVTSVTGLGSGKANINMTEVATNDGGLFNSSRLPSRNIVISLKYLWHDLPTRCCLHHCAKSENGHPLRNIFG